MEAQLREARRERRREGAELARDRRLVVDVERRAELRGETGNGADGGGLVRAVGAQGLEALVESRMRRMRAAILPASRRFAVRSRRCTWKSARSKDVVIVDLQGQLLAGVGDEILRNVVNELLAEGWKKILLNLSEVTAIDSAGTGELVASLKICEKFEAKLKLLNLHERVRKSLHLSELLPIFEVYDEESAALQHYA